MRKLFILFVSLFWAALPTGQAVGADERTWTAPTPRVQVAQDPTLLPRGKGFLFVPAMSLPRGNEPSYQIFRGDKRINDSVPGTGRLLAPGTYDVLIGSGAISQMMRKTVQVQEGSTTLLRPDWAGLVINVIDETRTPINESYEIYEERTQENYGIGLGIEEERGENVRTWLLKPGIYYIVAVGETFSTPRKFSVRLLPGELVQRNLVVDTDSGDFIGFYPPALQPRFGRTIKAWKSQWELSGSTLLNTTQNTAVSDRTSLSLTVQAINRSRYSTERNFASLRFILEEGATKEGDTPIRRSIDNLELNATYIYRLSERIGPYLRGGLNSKLFSTKVLFDEPRDFIQLGAEGDTLATFSNATRFVQSPSFFPLQLRQGLGINSQLFRTFPFNLDLRLGIGARQTYVADSFQLSDDETSATELETATSIGLEALLIMDARLARIVNLNSEFDILIPERTTSFWIFNWENRLRFFLTRYINLDIVLEFEREETLRRLQSRQQALLRFSSFF